MIHETPLIVVAQHLVSDSGQPARGHWPRCRQRRQLVNRSWSAEYQLPVGISNQNPVVRRLPLLNVEGFDQSKRQYLHTVNNRE